MKPGLIVRELGLVEYQSTWEAMRAFNESRGDDTPDELWLLEHPRVFTQGQAGKPEHLLMPGDIPVMQSDRGGQVTYHGPGQLVAYPLIDLTRRGYGARSLVLRIEQAIVATLASYGVTAYADREAPGVYVDIDGRRRDATRIVFRTAFQQRRVRALVLHAARPFGAGAAAGR